MDQGMFRAWLAEIDGLTAKQRQELEAGAGRPAAQSGGGSGDRGALGRGEALPALRRGVGGRGPSRRPAPFPLQELPQELQCADRNAAGPIAQEGTLA